MSKPKVDLKGKLRKLLHPKGDPKPGSSSTAQEDVPDYTKPDRNAENFVNQLNKVVAPSVGQVSGDKHIRELAGTVGPAIFSVATYGDGENYKIEYQGGNKVRFAPMSKADGAIIDSKLRIPSALVVGTIQADKLEITATKGNLESITFKTGQYQELDLSTVSPASCRFVLTTQLSGCTFAIGCVGTKLYMGHAQRDPKAEPFADDGKKLGDNLQMTRRTMFQNVANLESTFFVRFGEPPYGAQAESGITYDATKGYTSVLGLVSNRKFYLIVAFKLPESEKDDKGVKQPERIGNVWLVTLGETDARTGTRRWTTENLPKTW